MATPVDPAATPRAGGVSIRIFLTDGTPDGVRLVERSNWSGLGIVCPRSAYQQARAQDEFARPGVYVLTGPGEKGHNQIYVGEADVLNGTAPGLPPLSEADAADMESFLADMLLLLPVLDVSAFQRASSTAMAQPQLDLETLTPPVELLLTGPDTHATGADIPEGFLVRAGSTAREKLAPGTHASIRNLRDALLGNGLLVNDGDHLTLTDDYLFQSPSAAAGVMLGRSANGRREWANAAGVPLKTTQSQGLPMPTAQT